MTREQHLEAARWAGEWADTHVRVNLSPDLVYERATTAAHHAIAALQCETCDGRGWESDHGPVQILVVEENCKRCDGIGWRSLAQ